MRVVVAVDVLQELEDDVALVEGLVVVLERGHEPARVELEQRGRLVVGVDFDVLVGDLLFFQHQPDALHEGAEPAGVELERLRGGVGGHGFGGETGGSVVDVGVGVAVLLSHRGMDDRKVIGF